MRYIPILIIALFVLSCAQRPDPVNAGAAYNNWIAEHAEDDVIPENDPDHPDDTVDVTDDHEILNDPDTPEKDIDMTDDDIGEDTRNDLDEDMVDDDIIIEPMTCTADTCDDPASGLTWQRDSSYTGAQANSVSFCNGIGGFGGFANWRLPTIAELKTLRRDCDNDAGCTDAAVCYWDVSLSGVCDKPHWSATLAGGSQYSTLNFKTGKVAAVEQTVDQYARCVTDTTK